MPHVKAHVVDLVARASVLVLEPEGVAGEQQTLAARLVQHPEYRLILVHVQVLTQQRHLAAHLTNLFLKFFLLLN